MLFKDPPTLYYLHAIHSISLEFLRAKFLGQFWRVIELSSLGVFGEVLGQNQILVCKALLGGGESIIRGDEEWFYL